MIVELSLFNYLIFLLPIFWDSYYERSSLYFWLYTFVFKSLLFIINRAIPYFFARHIFFCLLSSGLNLLTVSFFLVVCKWILLFYSLCLWQLRLLLGVFMFNTVIDMVGVLLPLSFWFFFFWWWWFLLLLFFAVFCIIWFKKYFSVPFNISVA